MDSKAIATLGVLALGAVEGIDILSDVANGENFFKTTAKSVIITCLLGAKVNASEMLKRVQHDKSFYRKSVVIFLSS